VLSGPAPAATVLIPAGAGTLPWESQALRFDPAGKVLYRTGTRVSLLGDGWQRDKVFRVCGMVLRP